MRTKSIFAAILLFWCLVVAPLVPAKADGPVISGQITSTQSVVLFNVPAGFCGYSYQISGTWTGLIVVEASFDGNSNTWSPTTAVPLNAANATPVGGFTANGTGQGSIGGLTAIRFRGNTVSSGSATVSLRTTPGCVTTMLDNATGVAAAQSGIWQVTPSTSTSTLTLPATTTAYGTATLIANSATAGSVVNPSFAMPTLGGAVPRVRLSTNDATSTAWGGQTVRVDLWSASPTWTNGDRGAWSPATGTGAHIASYSCTISAEYGDGAFSECASSVGNFALVAGGTVYWSLQAVSGSGVTGASKVFTLVVERM